MRFALAAGQPLAQPDNPIDFAMDDLLPWPHAKVPLSRFLLLSTHFSDVFGRCLPQER
jgi:hypothetical protein